MIIGHTNKMGGVETFIYNTTIFSNKEIIQYDYLIHGYDNCVFENEINKFYGYNKHLYFIPKYKKNPLQCIKALIKFYKEHGMEYKYIHLQTGVTSEILYVFPYCLFIHPKVIVHSHNGSGSSKLINSIFRPIVNIVASKRFACSDLAGKWLFGKKNVEKVSMINNGIDTQKYQYNSMARQIIRKEYGMNNELVVGHIGRFSEQKNHVFLIEIFKCLKKRCPLAILLLVGTGELENSIKERVVSSGLADSVIFAGLKNNTEDYYSAFDIFVMPSLYEGLPIVGVEAQASGLPCLFSDNISKQVLLTDRVQLFSVQKSAENWADIIEGMDKKLEKRQNYSEVVRNKGFDIKDAAQYLERTYLS